MKSQWKTYEHKELHFGKKANTKWKHRSPINGIIWAQRREQVMKTGLLMKFTQNPGLKTALLQTGNVHLWEVPGRSKNVWAGEDGLLGRLLVEVRIQLGAMTRMHKISKS
eukprot:TRINITY_DN15073_c0_g2_i1.p1 TRINITY_DN15073_c0_g2~~TRINITY_DN15073_c0_g2_i1.p1  ORF type:complete len:110 (-),score=14.03 TRINITY_DN15073_c0_g2_i1:126-455(-)